MSAASLPFSVQDTYKKEKKAFHFPSQKEACLIMGDLSCSVAEGKKRENEKREREQGNDKGSLKGRSSFQVEELQWSD